MANPEHVKLAMQGDDAIRAWRRSVLGPGPHTIDDAHLREMLRDPQRTEWGVAFSALLEPQVILDLRGADLRHVDFHDRELTEVDFRNADLRGAQLGGCELLALNLREADLRGAVLSHSRLSHVALDGCDLRNSFLVYTILRDTSVQRGKLDGARFGGTILSEVTLLDAQGLHEVEHVFPSSVDFGTFAKSGQLPIPFLRGIGLPEKAIRYLPSLTSQSIQFYSCFISHSTRDGLFARRLHADLQDRGVRCWYAPNELRIGDRFRQEIDHAIRVYDKVLLILSRSSVESEWVESEVEEAFELERQTKRTVLFPIRLDDSVMGTEEAWAVEIRRMRHIGDFRRWKNPEHYQSAFDRLLRDLRAGIGEHDGT